MAWLVPAARSLCVVRARVTFDTRPPRDIAADELAYLYSVETFDERDGVRRRALLRLVSLERGKLYELYLPSDKIWKWFDVVA